MRTFVIAGVMCGAAAAFCFGETTVDETRKAAADGTVSIENVAGRVNVIGWDRDEVHVSGRLGEGIEEIRFDSSGSRTKIEVDYAELRGKTGSADLTVEVPRASRVEVATVSAPIDVKNVTGALDLQSVSGAVTVAGKPNAVEASSVSGNIAIESEANQVTAQTVSGAIVVKGSSLGGGELESVSGVIRFEGELTPKARLKISTMSGDVELTLAESVSAVFEASTFSGRIESSFGPEVVSKSGVLPGKSLEFKQGSGDADISINSFSGAIKILKAK